MKYIKLFENFNWSKNIITNESKYFEALKPSQFREYVKEFDRNRYLDIFKKIGDNMIMIEITIVFIFHLLKNQ
jgi:hypothetical protein